MASIVSILPVEITEPTPGQSKSRDRNAILRGVLIVMLMAILIPDVIGQKYDGEQPNIIFILADDMGYGDLACFGQETLKTPHLDRLANQGLRLTRHYAGSTVCAPSRCVLMTGLHQGNAPIRTNWDDPMADDLPTLASVLRSAGYRTGCFGKWGIGNVMPEDDPNRKGFDEFYGYVDMYHAHNFYPPFLVRNGKRESLRNVLIPGSDKGQNRGNGVAENPLDYAPELIIDAALDFIDRHAGQRFFLFIPLNTPHANNEGQVMDRGMEVPDFGPFADKEWPVPEKGFARMIMDIDSNVGLVIRKLRQLGIDENTLVIFSSDNGPHQEGGHSKDFFNSSGELRGRKRDLYEGGVRVPTIAWWPNHIAAGRESDILSGFQDYMPTFCELAGITSPKGDGVSMVPTLLGSNGQVGHAYLYWEFYEGGGKQAVVDKQWKAVRLNWLKQPDGPIELYDLETDPGEQKNLAGQHPEIVERMAQRIRQSHSPHAGEKKFPDRMKTPGK